MALDHTKLFDFIKIFFQDQATYKTLTDNDKARHSFMLNRFMAIQYPVNASSFNKLGIYSASIVDCWNIVAQRFKYVPKWMYTSVSKKKKEEARKFDPSDEVLNKYLEINNIGFREYKEALKFNFNEVVKDIEYLEKQMQVNGKNKRK